MICVTGGCGFIGSNFVLKWMGTSDEPVVNFDKLTYSGNPENLTSVQDKKGYFFIHGDIADPVSTQRIFSEFKPRAILNFAAESHVDRSISSPGEFIRTNINGTFNLLEQSRHYHSSLSGEEKDNFRFLHVSTDEVYGSLEPRDPAFTEDHPMRPNSPYAASKASSDHLVRSYFHTYGLPTLLTNCSNNYGPYHFPEKLIPLVITRAVNSETLPIYGNGSNVRDWLYVEDHCSAIQLVLKKGRTGECYNVGGKNERSNLEVVTQICKLLDQLHPRPDKKSYAEQIRFVQDRPGHDQRYAINAHKLETELGWRAELNFDAGLKKTVLWYLENKSWIANVTNGSYKDWLTKNYDSRK